MSSAPSRRRSLRRLPLACALLVLGAVALLVGPVGPAAARGAAGGGTADEDPGHLVVVRVRGLLDPIVADHVERAVAEAAARSAQAVVLQVDSPGGVLDGRRLDLLAFRLAHADVPVAAWVGKENARGVAFGQAARLVLAADVVGMGEGGRLGKVGELPAVGDAPAALRGPLDLEAAVDVGVVGLAASTLGDFIVELDGRTVGGVELLTAEVVETDEGPRRRPAAPVRFADLDLPAQTMHSVASPPVAYLLLVAGLGLLVFEFFTIGIGLAGVTGAVALVLAAYGLEALPVRWWALAAIVVGVLGFAVDVQAGTPRFWTGVGVVGTVVGSLALYDGVAVPWLAVAVAVVGLALAMVAGMPAMLRSRFATPTIGRESMVGEHGEAVGVVRPEGTVRIRGALWPARTNRATPIGAGDPVRVVAIDGLVLEVEPEAGGARETSR